MTALILALKTESGTRAAIRHAVGCSLRRDWPVVGTGKEQIVCIPRDAPDLVCKIQIHAIAGDAARLSKLATSYNEDAACVARSLGDLCSPTTYTVEAVDRARRTYAVVGHQPFVSIEDSLFYDQGVVSERAARLTHAQRRAIVDSLADLRERTGYLVDVVGIGNFVFVAGAELPVLIDTVPIRPDDPVAYNLLADEIDRRLTALLEA
jgi:hypothetical protein